MINSQREYIMITEEVVEQLTLDTKELFDFYDKKGLRKSKR